MEDNKIIFWSAIKGLEEIAPPQPAAKFIPKWWKDTPTFELGNENFQMDARPASRHFKKRTGAHASGTVKLCPAISEWFTQGYVIPLWFDYMLEFKENGEWSCETPIKLNESAELMDNEMFLDWLPITAKESCVGVLRLNCPWRIKTPAGYSVYQLPMWYHFNPHFEVPPGSIWSDEYHVIAPQLMIKHYGQFLIERGTPLLMIVPYKRELNNTFNYEIIKQDEKCIELETKSKFIAHGVFQGGYKKMQQQSNEKRKCPVHHDEKER